MRSDSPVNVFHDFSCRLQAIAVTLVENGVLPSDRDLAKLRFGVPRDVSHGDLTTNAAMMLARDAKRPPRELAQCFSRVLETDPDISAVETAGPGFINIRLSSRYWHRQLAELLETGPVALLPDLGHGHTVNVEYVSANPTGPPHVGTARGAVYGDVLASLLAAVGYNVTREYYVNDAGSQVNKLAWSVLVRAYEARGIPVDTGILDSLYPGAYLIDVGETLADRCADLPDPDILESVGDGDTLPETLNGVRTFAIDTMMDVVKADLAQAGVRQEIFSSERQMVESGRIEESISELERRGLVYTGVLEPPKGRKTEARKREPQLIFRSTQFGDDTDRALRKSDGTWSYFAPDIAYHWDKVRRGFDTIVNVFGADHAGYVKRLKAAVAALSDGTAEFDILLTQLVSFSDAGEPVRMSKRTGQFVTLREVVEAVGKDVLRFMMVTRRLDAPLEFDFVRVMEQSRDNPVFYVQYAHARACSALRKAGDSGLVATAPGRVRMDDLVDSHEIDLIRFLARWSDVVGQAAEMREPHRIANYLYDLAGSFHALWNRGRDDPSMRFVIENDPGLSAARLALVEAVRQVIAAGLGIIGVEPREEMR